MLEACLIFQLETRNINMENNYNWTTSSDYGGEGPNPEEDALAEHFVYLAVIPLPRDHALTAASALAFPSRAHDLPFADEF